MSRPPRWSRALLARLLPERDRRTLPNELDELWAREAARRGRARAAWWYRRQVARFALGLAAHRGRTGAAASARTLAEAASVDGWARDVRHGVRSLLRRPGFTAVAVASLALGIGANTAIFSVVHALLLRGLPVDDPERWVEVYTSDSDGYAYSTSSYPDLDDLRREGAEVFDEVLAYELFIAPLDRGGETTMLMGELVSGAYFEALGVRAHLGRVLTPSDDRPGAAVVVLSHDYWVREMGADPAAVGHTLPLRGTAFEIVGVAEPGFRGLVPGLVAAAWAPTGAVSHMKGAAVSRTDQRGNRSTFAKARLAPGVGLERARAWVEGFSVRLAATHPETNRERAVSLVPSADVAVHPLVDRALVPVAALLLAVVGVVLLVACVNLASFLLARAEERRREVALRVALGAGRAGLVRRFLVETVLLGLLGGGGGVLLARWTLDLLVRFKPPVMVPIQLDVGVDRDVLLFTLGVSVAAGLFFGLAPALRATRVDVAPALKGTGERGGGRRRLPLRDGLVVAQVAFSLLLLVGAGLFLRSLREAGDIDPGFYTGSAGIVMPNLAMSGEEDEAAWAAFYRELERRLLAEPGVEGVALADVLPLGAGVQTVGVGVPGVPSSLPEGLHPVDYAWVSPSYFDVLEVPIVRGRGFRAGDGAGDAPVAVVSEAFAARFWPGEDAVGRTLERRSGVETTVVGVARDTKVRTLGEAPRPRVYFAAAQHAASTYLVVVRGARPSAELERLARGAARDLRPGVVLMESKTMEEHLALMLFPPRVAALLLGVAGGLALLLSAIGVYGVVSYAVARRTREMGIRLSVGAAPGQVVRMVVASGMRLVLAGGAAGLVLAAGAGTLLSRFLYGVRGTDAATFLAIPLVLTLVAAVAAWLPARRAARVSPTEALRTE